MIIFTFLLSSFTNTFAKSNNFFIESVNNFSPQKNEISFVTFDSSYNYFDFSESSLQLSVDGANVAIDSILFFNSQREQKSSIFIAIEYSNAINNTDLSIINELLDFYIQNEDTSNCEITIALFSDNPILIKNPYHKNLQSIIDIRQLQLFPKPSIENFINSSYLKSFITQSKFQKQLLIISKSTFDYNKTNLNTFLQNNQIELSNIILPQGLPSNLIDATKLSAGFVYQIDNNLEKIKYLSFYNLLSDSYHKIFYHYNYCSGKHSIKINTDLLNDSLNFNIYPNEIADISPKTNYIDFEKIEVGNTAVKELIFKIINADFYISEMTSSNSNFKLLQDYNNSIIKKDSQFVIPIQFKPSDTLFQQSEITIYGKNCQIIKFYVYGGAKPKNEFYNAKFTKPDLNEILFSNEISFIKWIGTHPQDTLLLEYRLKGETDYKIITEYARNNYYAYRIPDVEDTLMQFRLAIAKPTWIDDRVIQLIGHKGKITDICWTSDNTELISSSEDGKIYLWNTSTGNLIKSLFQSQLGVITGIDLTKDDKYIAIAANDSIVKIWDKNNEILFKELRCSKLIKKVKFSYDGTKVIGISKDGYIVLWDLLTNDLYFQGFSQSTVINVLSTNPTRNIFATASEDGKVNIWNIANGNLIKNVFSANFEILDLKWSPSGTALLFSGNDSRINIYDIDQNKFIQTIFETDKPVRASEWATTFPSILISLDSNINIWSTPDSKFQKQYNQHISNVYRINSSHSSPKIASVDNSHTIHIWSLDDFPFKRPKILLDTTDFIKIINKKFTTPDLILPMCQVDDTLYLYYDSFVQNLTKQFDNNGKFDNSIFLQIDSIYQPVNNLSYNLNGYQNPFFLDFNETAPIGLTFKPQTHYDFATTISTASGIKRINSNVQVSVLSEIIDKKAFFIDFGNVELGKFKDTLFYLFQNISSQNISLDSIKFFYDSSFTTISPVIPYNMTSKGGVFVPKIRFEPRHIGYSSALAIFYFNNSIKQYCNFSGYSVGPRLEVQSEVNFDTLICDESEIKQIKLYNLGTSVLNIKNITIENDIGKNYKILSNISFDLLPQESKSIDVQFQSKIAGDFNALLTIKTNLQNNLDTIVKININTKKEKILLDTNLPKLIFNLQNDTNRIQKIIEINNIGSLLSNFQITYIPSWCKIDSVIYKYPLSLIYLTFIGGDNKKEYIDTLLLQDECNKIYKIEINVFINQKIAILRTNETIDFGLLFCSSKYEEKIIIENTGDTTLLITNINHNNDDFVINTDFPITIPQKQSTDLTIYFQNSTDGIYYDTLFIETNAKNSTDGIFKIPVKSELRKIDYSISHKFLNFDTVFINQSDLLSCYIKNNNLFPIKLQLTSTNSNYIISNSEIIINQNDSIQISITHKALSHTGLDLGKILISDTCKNVQEIEISANVIEEGEIYSISLLKPNPTADLTYLEIITNKLISFEIKIFDLQGKLVQSFPRVDDFQGNIKFPLNTRNIAQGVYIVEINTSKEKAIRKLIKLQ